MHTVAIVLIAAAAAGTMGGAWYLAARGLWDRRRVRVVLALAPPVACVALAALSGTPGAFVPLGLFGSLLGFCAAMNDHRLWLNP